MRHRTEATRRADASAALRLAVKRAQPVPLYPASVDAVLGYLAGYVAGVAIHDSRIVRDDGGTVTFAAKNYRDGTRGEHSIAGEEFVRRFLLHILPRRLRRLRYYGLLDPRGREARLERCRRLILGEEGERPQPQDDEPGEAEAELAEEYAPACPRCGQPAMEALGKMRYREFLYATVSIREHQSKEIAVEPSSLPPPDE